MCGLLVVPVSGESPWGPLKPPSKIYELSIWGPEHAEKGTWVTIEGRLANSDGSKITKSHVDIIFVDVFIDRGDGWVKTEGYMHPDNQGDMYGKYKITTTGQTKFYTSMTDPNTHVTTTSNIHVVNPYKEVVRNNPFLFYISMAKGFFALVFFGVLFVTIGTGAYAAGCHDPEKKEKYLTGLFDLVKVLFTVTVFYMVTLFLMGS